MNTEDIVIDIPVLIKAHLSKSGERKVACEVSNEFVDSENEVILQKALMDSADYFVNNGHLDLEHASEPVVARALGIKDPDNYIVGYPSKVEDLGESRTGMRGVIFKSSNGESDPHKNMYDMFWESLQTVPAAKWRASVFGQATDSYTNKANGAHVISGFKWKSLAFTRHPVNDSIKGEAHIVKATQYAEFLKNNSSFTAHMFQTRDSLIDELKGHILHNCQYTDNGANLCVASLREHFIKCRHVDFASADLRALALKALILR